MCIVVCAIALSGRSVEPARAQEHDPRLELRGQVAGPTGTWRSPLVVREDVAFLGAGSRLVAIDVHDAAASRVVGEVGLLAGAAAQGGLDMVKAVALDGDRIVALTNSRLHVVDASDPARLEILDGWPASAATPNAPAVPRFDALEGPLVIRDGVAYVAGTGGIVYRGWGDWRIAAIDLRDSAGPLLHGVFELGLPTGWGVEAMSVQGDELWLAVTFGGQMGDTGNGGLQRWDISEPARPALIQSVVAPRDAGAKTPPRWYEAYAIAVSDGLVALGTSAPHGPVYPGVVNDQSGRGGLRLLVPAPGGRDEMLPAGHWFAEDDIQALAWHGEHLFAATASTNYQYSLGEGPGRILLLGQGHGLAWQPLVELGWERSIRTMVKQGRRLYAVDSAGVLLVLETSLPEDGIPMRSRALLPWMATN